MDNNTPKTKEKVAIMNVELPLKEYAEFKAICKTNNRTHKGQVMTWIQQYTVHAEFTVPNS